VAVRNASRCTDACQVRQLVGSNLTIIGGIDSDILRQDTRAIQQAVAAVQPFVEEGHFIPLADGRVREDVPYPNYVFTGRN